MYILLKIVGMIECDIPGVTNNHPGPFLQNIKTADWSDEVAPFWGAVIKSAVSLEGIKGLFTAGWTTIKVLSCQQFEMS